MNGFSQTIAGLSLVPTTGAGTRTITSTAAATFTINNATDNTYGGVLTGAGLALTKSGDGLLSLTGNNTYQGKTTVSGGKLLLTGTTASTLFEIAGGAELEINVASGTRDMPTSTLTGGGRLIKSGTGTLQWGATLGTFACVPAN